MYAAPWALRPQKTLAARTLYSDVRPLGAPSGLLEDTPKKPTTTSLAAVVVSDGAEALPVSGVNAPLCASTGLVRSRPLKSRIAPIALVRDEKDQR